MTCAKEGGREYVEKQSHRGADDRSAEAVGDWKAKYGGMDVSQAQEAKQLRDENTKLRKLVAHLSLDKEALQSVIRLNFAATRQHSNDVRRFPERT
jgi:hypothetical protein